MSRGGKNKDLAAIDGKRLNVDGILIAITILMLLFIVVLPVFSIFYNAFFEKVVDSTTGNAHRIFDPKLFTEQITNEKNLEAMVNTVKIALGVTVLGTLLGTFYAWLLGRSDIPAKGLMRALFSIPYMFPPFLGAIAWDGLFNGRSGYVNKFLMNVFHLSSAPININSLGGIIFVEVSYYFPFVFMQVVSALERMDPTLEECARIAGAKQMTVIRKVTLPLVVPAISAGALLIMTTSLAHFGVPSILGNAAGIYTLPTKIYSVMNGSQGSFDGIRKATALSIMLVLVVAVALVLQKVVLSSGSYDIIKGKSMRPTLIKLRAAKIPMLILSILTLVLIVVVPLVMIVLLSLVKAYGLPLVPKNFVLDNYITVFKVDGTVSSIINSVILGVLSGLISMLLGTLVAYVVQKIRPKGKEVLEILSVLPYSLPGTVLAIGVILAFSGKINLYNTLWIILVAYVARYLSFSMKSSSAALLQVHPSLEEAARTCGASHMESLTDVTLPLIRPAMVSGFFLIFLPAMREVTTSVLLYGPKTRTLGVQIYSLRESNIPQSAALGTIAIIIIMLGNALITQITKDRKGV